MDSFINGKKIANKHRAKLYRENLKNPIPGVDAVWHKYTMTNEEYEKIHGRPKD